MYAASRLLFAMSRDGLLPRALSDIHEKFGTPYKALLFTFILSLIGPLFGREALLWFVDIASFGTAFAYLHVGLSTYKQHRNLALDSNIHEYRVKIIALLSSAVSLTFMAFLIYKLWLNYQYIPFLVIISYTFLGVLLYKFKSTGG